RWPQNIIAGPGSRPSSTPTTFGRPGAASSTTTSSPARAIAARATSAAAASPAAPGTSDGFTESAATSSFSSGSGSKNPPRCKYHLLSMRLSGRVIAITGASAGIGQATAELVASEGATVVLSARRPDRLTAVAKAIEAKGGRVLAIPSDVTREADMQALVD